MQRIEQINVLDSQSMNHVPCPLLVSPVPSQTKIKKFQQLTDRFRGGLITAPVYYDGVEDLFGEENVKVM